MTEVYFREIPEHAVKGKRLGRHVRHDPRSRAYRIQPVKAVASQHWLRHTPILDQGNLGSCTGNASCGALGTDPLYAPLAGKLSSGLVLDEAEAVNIYSLATRLDSYRGTYPPTDTGSDGLSAAKACKQLGLISGYVHALSLDDVLAGLQSGPMIVGTNWYEGMDSPDSKGVVEATGQIRGGHEYECLGVDVEAQLLWFANSWGTSFGQAGMFAYSYDTMTKLLHESGDATQFVPLSQPAPTPTPAEVTKTFTADGAAAIDKWAAQKHPTKSGKAAADAWKAAT